jgi:COP9 signalosome complex subunit 7
MHSPNEKLDHYLALAVSATGRAAADLVWRATADPGLHVFAELLSAPHIAALAANPAMSPSHKLLSLFAYGVYADYAASPSAYPPLSEAHIAKLRALSLITLARGRTSVPYALLASSLFLPAARDVEQLVLDAGAAGLVSARLDPRGGRVLMSGAAPRDVDAREGAGGVAELAAALGAWRARSERLLGVIDAQIRFVDSEVVRKQAEKEAREEAQAATREAIAAERMTGKRGGLPIIASGGMEGGGDGFGMRGMGVRSVGNMFEPIENDAGLSDGRPGGGDPRRLGVARSTRSRFQA